MDAVLAQSGKRRAYNSDLNVHIEPVDRDIVRPEVCVHCSKSSKGFKNCGLRWINDSELDAYLLNFAAQLRESQKEEDKKAESTENISSAEAGTEESVAKEDSNEQDVDAESDSKVAEGVGQKHHEDTLYRVWRCKTCDEFMANKVIL